MLSGRTISENEWETNGVRAAYALYSAAGTTPADVDVADPSSGTRLRCDHV